MTERNKLTETNWKQNFENVISNCKNKGLQLEKMACEKDGRDMAKTYNKFGDEASAKYNNYQSKPFDESKRSIGEDMSYFQQQCNSNFGLVLNFIKDKCKQIFFNRNLFFLIGFLILGIIFIFVGNFIKNKLGEIVYIIGIVLLVFAFISVIIKLLKSKYV
jgi:hypothetical protein